MCFFVFHRIRGFSFLWTAKKRPRGCETHLADAVVPNQVPVYYTRLPAPLQAFLQKNFLSCSQSLFIPTTPLCWNRAQPAEWFPPNRKRGYNNVHIPLSISEGNTFADPLIFPDNLSIYMKLMYFSLICKIFCSFSFFCKRISLSARMFQILTQAFQNSLFQPGNIRLRNAQPVGHLFLRMFTPAPQPEAQLHDFPVARRQAGTRRAAEACAPIPAPPPRSRHPDRCPAHRRAAARCRPNPR